MGISNQISTLNPNIQMASYYLNKHINGLYIYIHRIFDFRSHRSSVLLESNESTAFLYYLPHSYYTPTYNSFCPVKCTIKVSITAKTTEKYMICMHNCHYIVDIFKNIYIYIYIYMYIYIYRIYRLMFLSK